MLLSLPSSAHIPRHGCCVRTGQVFILALLAILDVVRQHQCHREMRLSEMIAHLPLCEFQVHLTAPLSLQSRLFFEASTDDAGRDGQVTIVAVMK